MLTYPWKCTVLHCNHLGNTWKPLVLMTRHFDYCPSVSVTAGFFVLCILWHWTGRFLMAVVASLLPLISCMESFNRHHKHSKSQSKLMVLNAILLLFPIYRVAYCGKLIADFSYWSYCTTRHDIGYV